MHILLLILCSFTYSFAELVISQARRELNLKSTVIREVVSASLYNTNSAELTSVDFSVSSEVWFNLSKVTITQKGHEEPLEFVKKTQNCPENIRCFTAQLKSAIASGGKLVFTIKMSYGNALAPFPKTIRQGEQQIVKFIGNLLICSPYLIENQKLTVR